MEKNWKIKKLCFVSFLLIISSTLFGQKIDFFDKDGDRKISEDEYLSFLLRTKNITYAELDADSSGYVTYEEKKSYFFADRRYIQQYYGGFPVDIDSLEEEDRLKKPGFFERAGILIRSDYDEITIYDRAKSFSRGDPAIFSYTKNSKDDVGLLTLQGALMKPFEMTKETDSTRMLIVPSIYFNRKVSSNSEGEVNNLTFRIGLNREWNKSKPDKRKSTIFYNLRASAAYATDFDFDSEVLGFELDFEPSMIYKGMGVYRNFDKEKPNRVRFMWRIYGHLELGTTNDVGENENLEEGSFTRLGLRGEVGLLFGKRFEVKSKLGYLYGLSEGSNNSDLINLKTIYMFDDKGRWTLNFEYQKGNIPLLQQEVDNWTFGLGIKF